MKTNSDFEEEEEEEGWEEEEESEEEGEGEERSRGRRIEAGIRERRRLMVDTRVYSGGYRVG